MRPRGALRRHHLAGLLQQHHEPHHLPAVHAGLQAGAGEAPALLLLAVAPEALAGSLALPPQLRGAERRQQPPLPAGLRPHAPPRHRHRRGQPAGRRARWRRVASAAAQSGRCPGLKWQPWKRFILVCK